MRSDSDFEPDVQTTLEPIPDELEQLPNPVLELPPTRSPDLLPLRALSWVDFERLCVRLARHVDGLRSVRRYGRSGQDQRGLDLFGTAPSGDYVVYQARDIETLTGPMLKAAVEVYVSRGRAFGATRFVLAVACAVCDTKVDNELVAAQHRHPDLEIELYDAQRITDLLRGQREIVSQFFTDAWADIFAPPNAGAARVKRPPARQIDELLHGPLTALGLADDLTRADERRRLEPKASAEIYGRLWKALEQHGYQGHAAALRREHAGALAEAGENEQAFNEFYALGVQQFERGEFLQPSLSSLEKLAGDDERRDLLHQGLAAANAWLEHAETIDQLAEIVSAIEPLDAEEARRLATWLAEFAIVDRRPDIVATNRALLLRLAEPAEALQLQLAIAEDDDATGWAKIGREGLRRGFPAPLSALCCMRAGRWAFWHGDPEQAFTLYRRAVEFATDADLPGDAQSSLWATVGITLRYGPLDFRAIEDTARIANVLDATPTFIPGRTEARTAALRELDDQKPPQAHRLLRRLIHLATVAGDLELELDGRRRLARLYQAIGLFGLATENYIAAGDDKTAAAVAPQADEFDVDWWVDHPAPWVRAAGWAALTARADLLPDADVDAIAGKAVRDLGGMAQAPNGPQVFVQAMRTLTALGARLTKDRTESVLKTTKPWIDRTAGTYRWTDDAMVEFFVIAYNTQPELRDESAEALFRCLDLVADRQRVARLIMRCEPVSDLLRQRVTYRAEAGDQTAVDLLAFFGVEHAMVVERAKIIAQTLLARPTGYERSDWGLGAGFGLYDGYVSALAARTRGALARKLVDLAEDIHDLAVNRAQALDSLAVISQALSARQRTALFPRVFALASDEPQLNPLDQSHAASLHPLSRFRLDIATDELRPSALQCAASLTTTREQARACQSEALRAAWSGVERMSVAAAIAFVRTAELVTVDPSLLLSDPRPVMRRAGIAIWAEDPTLIEHPPPNLATDSDQNVRRELAAHLDKLETKGAPSVAELRRQLAHDPSANVRRLASRV